jgi:small-conductance mechanosensitive channel
MHCQHWVLLVVWVMSPAAKTPVQAPAVPVVDPVIETERRVKDAIARLRVAVAAIPNVKDSPAPDIEILQFTPEGPLLCVRPYTHTDHYWQVYFDTHKAVATTFGSAGYPVPETPVSYRTVA